MMTGEEFARVISMIEGAREPGAIDNSTVLTSYRVRPYWLWKWANCFSIDPAPNETWESFVGRVVAKFGDYHLAMDLPTERSAVHVAMLFHRDQWVEESSVLWDEEYAKRFLLTARRLAGWYHRA